MKLEIALANRILYYCHINNLNINSLADKCLISQSTIENIMLGNSKNPKLKTILKICEGLNIELKDFFDSTYFEKLIERGR